ncbi:cation acetate symporter [Streptomyces sp. LHD-70]|uniref:sodium/solute symporter n=1 Tax=Streptomyces sp. LHD-70 TaxID=3072140 RepID=UPI00280EEBDD|nr:cation acetate symporter [Streptomyces sp. LHD-70]MDQ8708304.1 cation acetate symporter [Streptomyces sp. LHD-70]
MTEPTLRLAAQSFDLGSPGTRTACLIAFTAVATLTLLLCVLTGPDREDLDEFYTGSRSLSPLQSGFAIAGDYISAATLLGTIGVIALTGYDGVVLALSTALSLVLLMFLLAEPLRNAGRFTMGDAFARRLGPSSSGSRGVRIAACAATLAALLPLMVVQLAVSGEVLVFILGVDRPGLRAGCILLLGALMISYAAIGGMKGTALIQIIKIVLLLGAGTLLAGLVLHRFGWSPAALLSAAERGSGAGPRFLESGLQFAGTNGSSGGGGSGMPRLDMISSELTVVLGGACLPHVTMRMYAPRSAPALRRSMSWAVSSVAVFALLISVIGFGATALVGRDRLAASDGQGNTALLLTAQAVFGPESPTLETFVFTAVTAMVFLTVLASVAGMILACANSLAHDVFAHRPGRRSGPPAGSSPASSPGSSPGLPSGSPSGSPLVPSSASPPGRRPLSARRELVLARVSTAAVGLTAIALAVSVQHLNLQPLVSMSFCLGASALAPALVYSLFWRRYTRTGLICTLVGGTLGVLVLLTGTNLVSGTPGSAFPDQDFNWFPFTTTGIASIPLGFLLGWLGTVLTPPRARTEQRRQYEAVEAWILAGARRR